MPLLMTVDLLLVMVLVLVLGVASLFDSFVSEVVVGGA
jgi:hypothetical protein